MPSAPLLSMRDIVMQYPGVRALDGVTFELEAGEVHCLVGENGAGKSTLMNILSGAVSRTSGTIGIDGRAVDIASPADSQRLGIGMIYQESRLVPGLTVAENIVLGHESVRRGCFIDRADTVGRAQRVLARMGEDIDVRATVRTLGSAAQQIVEIAKALSRRLRVLVLDEPTAALTDRETERLFDILRGLRHEGTGIIYISHRLAELEAIGDRVTVLRDGRTVGTAAVGAIDRQLLIRLMVGRDLGSEYPVRETGANRPLPPLFELDHVSAEGVTDVSLSVHAGEIVGVAGLIGSGKVELSRAVFGAVPLRSGSMRIAGRDARPRSPREAIALGIALLTEDRNALGLMMHMDVRQNITLSSLEQDRRGLLISRTGERKRASRYVELLGIRPPRIGMVVRNLSGGNRQKVVLARWLATNARLLVFNEPTAGVDVGAKAEMYAHIAALVAEGKGALLISSDLPELIGMCDRIAVMHRGRIADILPRERATQEALMTLATGHGMEDARHA